MGVKKKCWSLLLRGDKLCRSWETPMPSTTVQEVKEIYKNCECLLLSISLKVGGDTPLLYASRLGLTNMVWGFIQYAKQTNTNPYTGETLELQKFLGLKNYSGQTALDVAIEKDTFDVLRAFATTLEGVSWQELITDRNDDGKTLMSLLSHHEFDEIIFMAMKAAGKGEVDSSLTSISISIDEDNHQEYTEHTLHPNTQPLLSQYEQSTTLKQLDDGQLELAPNGNTIIHLLSQFGRANDVKTILEKHPSLVYRRNHQGETPLFVASREGHLDILELLINYVKEKTDLEELVTRRDRYNALHIAIENHHAPIVFWLVNGLPQLANRINVFDESPLYFAAQRGYRHILRLMLDESKENSFEGPNGKNALHAVVMSQESVKSQTILRAPGYLSRKGSYRHISNLECVKSLLREKIDLLYIHDKNGWAPFHYAVYHDIEKATVQELLQADPNIGSLDIIDSKGRNILHVAVENRKINTIKKLFGDKQFRTLANQRDSDGNTPLHIFMASDIEIDKMKMDRGVNIYAVNNENLTTLDVASSYEKRHMLIKAVKMGAWRNLQTSSPSHVLESSDSKSEREMKVMAKFGDSLVVVTALIATASFAAAFTVPGGFDGNEGSKQQGMPILLRKAAYKAFVVSNALAFCCSCCVLFGYMRLQMYLVRYIEEKKKIGDSIYKITALQYILTGIAMVAMASAFITGTYVILAPSLAFAISFCATCACIIVPLSFFPTKYFQCFVIIVARSLEYLGLDYDDDDDDDDDDE